MITRSLSVQSNSETFGDSIDVTDDAGNPISFADISEIYVSVSDPECCSPILTARKTTNTVTARDDGSAQFSFTPAQMAALCPHTYEFAVLVTVSGVTKQTHRCRLPIIEGPQ